MKRILQIGGLLLAAGVAASADQAQKGSRAGEWKGGTPKAITKEAPKGPKLGPPIMNPRNPTLRLYTATPEQRERAIEKFPPRLQERIRKQLDDFDHWPKDQQEATIRLVRWFSSLPPEQQEAIEARYAALVALPDDRKQPVRAAIRRLQGMTAADRNEVLNRPQFRSRFSPDELKLISELSAIIPPEQ